MNEFVEECRREWKRLGVPDPVATEMAADLLADLEEAEAEGTSAEDVLGSGAFDARSFAASWAAERGVSRPPRLRERGTRRSFILAALAVLFAIVVSGAALAIFGSSGSSVGAPELASRPSLRPLPSVVPPPSQADESTVDPHAVGLVLLIVGLAGIVLLTFFWLWIGPGPRSRSRTYIDDRPTGPAY